MSAHRPLPPHMRGKRRRTPDGRWEDASTPAYAGQTDGAGQDYAHRHLYPRICGANLIPKTEEGELTASTPAYAGQTAPAGKPRPESPLYPRICGANLVAVSLVALIQPLPPHMRGKLPSLLRDYGEATSTPAYAGQTQRREQWKPSPPLYPRICGANWRLSVDNGGSPPLPPHMRGKPAGARRRG